MVEAVTNPDSASSTDPVVTAHCFHQHFAPRQLPDVSFDRDYLMYATSGGIRLAINGRQWTLAPAFAALIPAKTPLDVDIPHHTTCCSILFQPGFVEHFPNKLTVFNVPKVLRGMINYSRCWPEDRTPDDTADVFFKSIANLAIECAQTPSEIWHPLPESAAISRAIAFTQAQLAEPLTLNQIAKIAQLSERTFLRRFAAELGMSWLQYLRRLRISRAVELLSTTADPIAQIALAVGYNSLSAFNKAFREFSSQTPAKFRMTQQDNI